MNRLTRREALGVAALGAGSLLLSGCGAAGGSAASTTGSTLASTWVDPLGDGQLRVGGGEPLRERVDLGPRARLVGEPMLTLAHVTDAHVLDASSPARVTFLDRLGPPFQSTFRPQEALTVQVLGGAVQAIRALAPDLVIQGGDVIDNDQSNELSHALKVLGGGVVSPGSGRDGYHGVQLASDIDPFYYRPDVDAPRHPGLLRDSVRRFRSPGLRAPILPVLGDHDILVAGELVPTPLTQSLAVGARALWELPGGLSLPAGARVAAAQSPDGPPSPGLVDPFLRAALAGPTVDVPPDPSRREMEADEVVSRLAQAGRELPVDSPGRLDYAFDAGREVRVVVLDLVRRGGGSGGLVDPAQPAWLAEQIGAAAGRWVLVVTHHPIGGAAGGDALRSVLDRSPRVLATLAGHIHRNSITARPTASGGYWEIVTASLIDYPQQARALRLHRTAGGGVAISTWMLDHVRDGRLGEISRQLSYIDAQGGRPHGFAGAHPDRNAVLFRRA